MVIVKLRALCIFVAFGVALPAARDTITPAEIAGARTALPPPTLNASPGRQDFDLKGDSKALFEELARAFHLLVVFDGNYQSFPTLRFHATAVDYREALTMLEAATDSFVIPEGGRLMLVARDSPQNRQMLEKTVSLLIPVPEPISIQEAAELVNGLRGMLEIQRLMLDGEKRLILVRDRVSHVRAAQAILLDLMRPRPQVSVEVELLAADRNSTLNYGLGLPTTFSVVSFGHFARSLIPPPIAGGVGYLAFGGGKSFLGIGIADSSLFSIVSKASTRTLYHSELVALDNLPASLHVGEKYPILSAGYFGRTTGTGRTFSPPPTVNFEDLGLVLKITPHVHGTDEISLDVEAEFKLLTGQSSNGIPVIANKKFESKIRLMDGQWAVMAGLMTSTEAESIQGLAGLSSIPLIGKLLRSNTKTHDATETLLVLKPRLSHAPPDENAVHTVWVGSEGRSRTQL